MTVLLAVLLVAVLIGWMADRWHTERARRLERVGLLAATLARTPHELTTAVQQIESAATAKPRRRRRTEEPEEPQIAVGL